MPVVATEFVATSISSNGDAIVYGRPYSGPMVPEKRHSKFCDGDRRGYVLCTLTPHGDNRLEGGRAGLHARLVVENGVPGGAANRSSRPALVTRRAAGSARRVRPDVPLQASEARATLAQ